MKICRFFPYDLFIFIRKISSDRKEQFSHSILQKCVQQSFSRIFSAKKKERFSVRIYRLYKQRFISGIIVAIIALPLSIALAIASGVGRTQKTSFALTMGQILAKERAVLYLNMESYSGFERLLECSYDRGMSDILYYARQENQGIIYKLGGMVQSMQNLDYLPRWRITTGWA